MDIIAEIINNRVKKTPFYNNSKFFCILKENCTSTFKICIINKNNIEYHKKELCGICFLSPKYYIYTLWKERVIEIFEKDLLVGTMTVKEIKNPILNRALKYKNQENILNDKTTLNTALKRHLEWGKEMKISFESKLLKDIPNISVGDIKKLTEYIKNISENILWDIYYNNYDRKTDKLKINSLSEIKNKYPWIDEENLKILHTQGMYYAWHG